jgi:hypothetical protein
VVNDKKNTPIKFLNHLNVIMPLNTPIDVGIPPPLIFGMRLYMKAKKNDIANSATIAIKITYGFSFISEYPASENLMICDAHIL